MVSTRYMVIAHVQDTNPAIGGIFLIGVFHSKELAEKAIVMESAKLPDTMKPEDVFKIKEIKTDTVYGISDYSDITSCSRTDVFIGGYCVNG